MTSNIGEVGYNTHLAQKNRIREITEKSINSLFQRNVINQEQRDSLLQKYLRGEIDFGADGLTEQEAMNFTEDTYNTIENKSISSQYQTGGAKTTYIVQAGDTTEIIAEKLGISGDDAKVFAEKLKAKAIKEGMYHKYGFNVGDMLTLDGDYSAQIEQLKVSGSYVESTDELEGTWLAKRKQKIKNKNNTKATTSSASQKINKPKGNQVVANKVQKEAISIANQLKTTPTFANKAFDKVNSKNIVFVLAQYNNITGRNLAKDMINNGDKFLKGVKDKICWQLAKRAQELKVGGVYYGDYMKIPSNKPNELLKWIENAQAKVYAAEKRNNPAIGNVQKKVIKQKNTKDIKTDARKVATELYNQIDGASKNDKTIALLQRVNTENVAFVVSEYKNVPANKNKRSLVKDIDEEWGLDINHVKHYICKPLAAKAKSLGLTGIYYGDYNKITDINQLDTWVNKAAARVRAAMEGYNSKQANVIDKNTSAREKVNSPIYKEAGIKTISQKKNSKGEVIEATYYYKDGKVVREYQDAKRGRVRELVKSGSTQKPELTKITDPVPMTISVPNNASENAKKFANALEENKARLMSMLGIDNDTYNKLARLAMAIAEQETNFGNNGGMYRNGKYYLGGASEVTQVGQVAKLTHDFSFGPTQIKFEMQKRDKWIADKFSKLGLTNGANLYNMTNAAMVTMVVLVQNNRILKNNSKYQKGIEAANGAVVTIDGWEMKNGHLEKTYNTKSFVNKVTDEDALCYMWNGRMAAIKDGTMEPEALEYTRNVHKYSEKYRIKENSAIRANAIQKSKDKKVIKNFTPMDNNGPVGSVVFMPKMYNYTNLKDQSDELQVLRTSLNKNAKIDNNSKKLLLLAVEHGEIGFEFGLTAKEADSLTQRDVDMMLSQVSKLKQQIKDSNIDFSDGVNQTEAHIMRDKYMQTIRDAEFAFKKEYLASKSPKISLNNVPAKNLLRTPMHNGITLPNNTVRRGFAGKVPDNGVNTTNTSQASIALAKSAQNVAKRMNSAGYCMTGFRNAMLEAGISAANAKDLVEGTPKATVGWFERHPDMFEEVKYVQTGSGARQINSTDLPNLPAGYIAVWIPDKNFSNEPGHISITNGNGQAYADETDNLDWGVYHGSKNAGKGEHGTFRVFRLTDKWKVVNGKLKFEG